MPTTDVNNKTTDFACIITAYKHADISYPLIESLLQQNYQNFMVYLVADDCDVSDYPYHDAQYTDKIVLLHPSKKLGSKVKSMIHGLENFKRQHEAIIIFDPDNLAIPDYLAIMNNYFQAGYQAVQGQRTAKNLDSIYACADSISEMYYNYTCRYAPFKLGSSAGIAGSAMGIETNLFKAFLQHPSIQRNLRLGRVIPAEDKLLHDDLVRKDVQIAFAKTALVYDEKVGSGEQVSRQRVRWLYSYFDYVKKALRMIVRGFTKPSWNMLLFGFSTLYPPLFLLVLSAGLLFLINLALGLYTLSAVLFVAGVLFFVNLFLVLLLSKAPAAIWKSLWGVPAFVFYQLKALLNVKKAKNDFMVTRNTHTVSINEVLKTKEQ